ncbi:MAG TPA: TonB-dependent receptor plug domain-containing protein, partial [Chitinophagaceae bacterium]|nr:TonB-dependent receptor plug domain-containing protein [Chitinophagaceae bacterium]
MLANLAALRSIILLLVLTTAMTAMAQKTVTGKVTGPDSKPLLGVTVAVKGTTVATVTSVEGIYTITMPPKSDVLVFSSVGYDLYEANSKGNNTVDVVMKLQTTSLNEVVVTGYTAQRKKDITGSVSVVNVGDLKQTPVGTGEEALQGRASGVTVISSAQPGGASDIRIRGITSFYGNNAPLVIVDGVRSNLHDINANDIESMQVLKDASAAIYGVAGSNGVIIITTKRGKTGRARVNYDAYVGITTRGKGYDMANTQEEANAIWLQQKNSGVPIPSHLQFGTGANPTIPDYLIPTGVMNGAPGTDPALYDINSNQITQANKAGTDWYDEITRNAFIQSHNLSVSAGSDKSNYFFSVNYLNQEGILRYQYLERYAVRANTQFVIKDKIRVGENAYVFYKQNPRFGNQSEGSPFTTSYRESAIIPVYDIMGNFAGTKANGLGNA